MGRLAIELLFFASGGVIADQIFRRGFWRGLVALICLLIIAISTWNQIIKDVKDAFAYSPILTVALFFAVGILTYLIVSNITGEKTGTPPVSNIPGEKTDAPAVSYVPRKKLFDLGQRPERAILVVGLLVVFFTCVLIWQMVTVGYENPLFWADVVTIICIWAMCVWMVVDQRPYKKTPARRG